MNNRLILKSMIALLVSNLAYAELVFDKNANQIQNQCVNCCVTCQVPKKVVKPKIVYVKPKPKPQPAKPQTIQVQVQAPQQQSQPIIINNNNYNTNNNTNNNTLYPQSQPYPYPYPYRSERVKAQEPSKKKLKTSTYYPDHNHVSLYGFGSPFTSVNTLEGEVEFRDQRWGLGLFAEKFGIQSAGCTLLSGYEAGLSLHYHFTPFWYIDHYGTLDPGLYAQVGYGRFYVDPDDRYFSGLTAGAGLDLGVHISPGVKLYGRAGLDYLKDGNSFWYAGEEFSIGLRFDFH